MSEAFSGSAGGLSQVVDRAAQGVGHAANCLADGIGHTAEGAFYPTIKSANTDISYMVLNLDILLSSDISAIGRFGIDLRNMRLQCTSCKAIETRLSALIYQFHSQQINKNRVYDTWYDQP